MCVSIRSWLKVDMTILFHICRKYSDHVDLSQSFLIAKKLLLIAYSIESFKFTAADLLRC